MIFDQTKKVNWFWKSNTGDTWWVRDRVDKCRLFYGPMRKLVSETWDYPDNGYEKWADERGAPITTLLQLLITGPI